ncbi:two-component-system connector protein YcgZ [Yokenella regensburgei]|uniref:regulatory protein YcgZ n=1 Tax=Yokenella regensburgei TaxID=158877 RepID=UPI003F18EE49
MRQTEFKQQATSAVVGYFARASLPSQQQTLGQITREILSAGERLNRKALCDKLLAKLGNSTDPATGKHYQELLNLLFI